MNINDTNILALPQSAGRKDEKTLNDRQKEAVSYGEGPLLIIAGAGTGKTTVITERIKQLITSGKAQPNQILALTFTEKAAREMEERIDLAMPYGYTQMWVMTFHSFCDRLLRDEALNIGLNPRYKLMTQAESTQLIRKHLFQFELDYFRPLGNPMKFILGMLQHFSRLQDEDISPQQYLQWANSLTPLSGSEQDQEVAKWQELAKAYQTYDDLKIKDSVFDFGDLIIKTLSLFRQRKNILKHYQQQFKYVLVDEFQDTNYAQNQLAIMLAGKSKNITVCGDDDQSIYRFRGAAVSNIVHFRSTFPKAKAIVLAQNYRSVQQILDASYALIQFNNPDRLEIVEKIDKKLVCSKSGKNKGSVGFIHANRVENEAETVASKIREMVAKGNYEYKDFAVLVRANTHAEPFIRSLSRHGIPHQFLGPGKLFKQPEVIDLIAFLKVLYNFEDSVAFYRLLSIEYFSISSRDLAAMGNYARKFNKCLFEVAENIDDVFVAPETKEKVKFITQLITKYLKVVHKESAGQLLYDFLQDTNLLQKILSPDSVLAEKKAANISKFFDKLKSYEVDHEDATAVSVVDWIELSSELGESPLASDSDWTDVNAVNILTIHSSKGLEFPVVFLVNLVSQRFPTIERREQIPIPDDLIKEVLPQGDYHLQEERRLAYVGMTRAKEQLFLTAANFYGEAKRQKKLSPFIFEALGENAQSAEQQGRTIQQLSFMDYSQGKRSQSSSDFEERQPLHVDYLSYSQIETFRICPLHYKLKYIYKVPTPPSSSQSFGNSFHSCMKAFYEEIQNGEKPSSELIEKILIQNWIGEGYLSKSHEVKSFDKARKFLTYYLEKQYKQGQFPAAMEQPFLIKLDGLKVGGKIDRIDVAGEKVEIIDYKTGANPPSQREVDNNLQLSIYALAATKIPEYPFARKVEDIRLSLYFFDPPRIITTSRTAAQLEKAAGMIVDYKTQIETSDFMCSGNMLCENCEYKLFCRSEEMKNNDSEI